MQTMTLSGFMTRQWHSANGKKFRSQVRRRAERQGGDHQSVEIRDADGFMVDYYTCPDEMAEIYRIARAAGY